MRTVPARTSATIIATASHFGQRLPITTINMAMPNSFYQGTQQRVSICFVHAKHNARMHKQMGAAVIDVTCSV